MGYGSSWPVYLQGASGGSFMCQIGWIPSEVWLLIRHKKRKVQPEIEVCIIWVVAPRTWTVKRHSHSLTIGGDSIFGGHFRIHDFSVERAVHVHSHVFRRGSHLHADAVSQTHRHAAGRPSRFALALKAAQTDAIFASCNKIM